MMSCLNFFHIWKRRIRDGCKNSFSRKTRRQLLQENMSSLHLGRNCQHTCRPGHEPLLPAAPKVQVRQPKLQVWPQDSNQSSIVQKRCSKQNWKGGEETFIALALTSMVNSDLQPALHRQREPRLLAPRMGRPALGGQTDLHSTPGAAAASKNTSSMWTR